jgi:multidrug resistance efflux pump
MTTKYILPVLAVSGVLFAVMFVRAGNKPVPPAEPVAEPAMAPYDAYVAGAGLVEASTENIAISTPVPGLVTQVLAKVGAQVKQGDPLFKLDDRDLQAELIVRQSALSTAKAKLEKLKSLPRPEDVPPAEAKVAEARASLNDAKELRAMWNGVEDSGVVSAEELQRRDAAVAVAQAKYDQAQSELKLLNAGSWKPDIEIAAAEVAAADAQVKATQTNIARLTVTAPVDGEVLQVKVRPGEYAQAGPLATPLMLLGDVSKVHVRVDIDENDAWRVAAAAPAVATVRGNRDLKTNLKFVRIEPYVVPKRSLTGESTERVDTRVLQVLYSFDRVFLIRAAGRDSHEILAELERRLGNDDAAERAETVRQLGEIMLLRLRQVEV